MKRSNKKEMGIFAIIAVIVSTMNFPSRVSGWTPRQSPIQSTKPETRTSGGVRTATFETAAGRVTVYLPDDMRAGDTISGTVIAEPSGQGGTGNDKKTGELSGYVVEVENVAGAKTSVTSKLLKMRLPSMLVSGSVALILRDRGGRELSRTQVPCPPAATAPSRPNDFQLPAMGQTGRPVTISGPFDGDLGNTGCNISDQTAQPLAESPRKAVFLSPTNVVGPAEIKLTENDTTKTGPFRNLAISLTAPKTTLLKGETTTLTVKVEGLQGLNESVPLQLDCAGAVNMSGGNSQNIQIQPNGVQSDGSLTQTFTLTATQAGAWAATGVVQTTPAQQPCNLAGQIVHVENNYGGKKGDWVIGIKTQDGTKGFIHIPSEKQPALKFCDWIKINDCRTDDNGSTWVDGYEPAGDPTKKPPTLPKPPDKPKPPDITEPKKGGDETTLPPCKEGDKRPPKVETKTFEFMDRDSTVFFEVYTDKDDAATAAKNMSDFWKGAKKVGDKIVEKIEDSTVAGWVLAYLERGSDILDAILKSPLKDAGVTKVTAQVVITTRKVTATCITVEVCEKGRWVTKKVYKEDVARSVYRNSITANLGDDNWEKISDPSTGKLDRAKMGKWAQDWLKDQLNILKKGGDDYNEFKANCK